MKSAEANVATNEWVQRVWLLLLGAGLGVILRLGRSGPAAGTSAWPLGFLLVPLPFYSLSVAYSGVPIFIPYWWPFTHYNVRYGLQLLPAFAVAIALMIYLVLTESANGKLRSALALGTCALVVASYVSVWRATQSASKKPESICGRAISLSVNLLLCWASFQTIPHC